MPGQLASTSDGSPSSVGISDSHCHRASFLSPSFYKASQDSTRGATVSNGTLSPRTGPGSSRPRQPRLRRRLGRCALWCVSSGQASRCPGRRRAGTLRASAGSPRPPVLSAARGFRPRESDTLRRGADVRVTGLDAAAAPALHVWNHLPSIVLTSGSF